MAEKDILNCEGPKVTKGLRMREHILPSPHFRIGALRRRWKIRLLVDTPGQVGDRVAEDSELRTAELIELPRNEGNEGLGRLRRVPAERDHALPLVTYLRHRNST